MTNLLGCRLGGDGEVRALLILVMAIGVVGGAPTLASDRASSAKRAELFERQTRILDSRASSQYANSVRLRPEALEGSVASPRYAGSYRGTYLTDARQAARKHGVPEDLFLRLVQQESGWNPRAISNKGAIGLAQLMPGTARALRVDPKDPKQNLEGGARYLAEQYRTFRDWRLALAAYNAGPGAVKKYNGVPPFRETQGYVRAILGR